MLLRTKLGGAVPSFDELSKIIHRREGMYSWEYGMLTYLSQVGFDVKFISEFDLRVSARKRTTICTNFFGAEAAEDQIRNSDMNQAIRDIEEFLRAPGPEIDSRTPQISDVKNLLRDGFYLIPYVNQRIFQCDPGYVAHTIFVYGFSERGIRVHNPGPPATEAAEISWDLFEKAWSSPSQNARILFAARAS